jgi:hypothetical protein
MDYDGLLVSTAGVLVLASCAPVVHVAQPPPSPSHDYHVKAPQAPSALLYCAEASWFLRANPQLRSLLPAVGCGLRLPGKMGGRHARLCRAAALGIESVCARLPKRYQERAPSVGGDD